MIAKTSFDESPSKRTIGTKLDRYCQSINGPSVETSDDQNGRDQSVKRERYVDEQYFSSYMLLEKETAESPPKRKRSSLPPPTSGSSWISATLQAYSISFRRIHELDKFLFQR